MASTSTSVNRPPPVVPHGGNYNPLAPGEAIVINDDVGALSSLTAFSIRNGDTSAARSLLIRPAVSAIFHWCPISGLPSYKAIPNAAAFIRVAHTQLTTGTTGDRTREQLRKMAIAIGVIRAVVTDLYEITDSDLIPGERATPMLVAKVAADGSVSFNTVEGLDQKKADALKAPLTLTELEKAAIAAIHMSAIGIPPCQGYSLMMTGHHYLSDPKSHSRRCYKVIERAHWELSTIKEWFDSDIDILRDAIWHKSCHPISMSFKIQVSQSEVVKDMIVKAGAGAAASRLPAVESVLRRATSYRTLLQTVRQMYEETGGMTSYLVLDEAISAVEHFPYGTLVTVPHGFKTVPLSVDTRDKALKHLENVCNKSDDVIGHAWGFFVAMDDRSQMMSANAKVSSLRTANSLSKLDTVSPASYRAGMTFYEDYAAMKAAKRAKGEYSVVNLVIAPVNERGIEVQFQADQEAGGT